MRQRTFAQSETVDFVIVGSGSAGGIMAKELATAGFSVVVLEQGPWRNAQDFRHDEFDTYFYNALLPSPADFPQTFRKTADEKAEVVQGGPPPLFYSSGVGGSSVHFTANFWRFRPVDFRERSLLGAIPGTGFADWPITYEEIEPYYTRVDWEIGVSGAPGPNDPPRSRPYPLPPMPVKSSGVLLEAGARKLGLNPQPAPLAILSQPFNGRNACAHCGYCMGYGCEMGAKSSTLAAMIPAAMDSGNCEIRPLSTVLRVDTNAAGRATGVTYVNGDGAEQRQPARAVILAANGAETPRLLLLSHSPQFPDGLANSSGLVGKYMMWNAHGDTYAAFEHPLNEYKSVQVTRIVHDFYDSDPKRGFYGGGGLDGRLFPGPIMFSAFNMPPDEPWWGQQYKDRLREYYTRTMQVAAAATSLPLETNTVTLDPDVKDVHGRPALRATYRDHPDDVSTVAFLQERAREIMEAAGARKVWGEPAVESTLGAHLLGTCRMGDDPRTSVVDRYHRTHDVPNLFICDGSSFVTSGRGQPTMTIMALAFRASEHIARAARQNTI
ncbi:MAG TPA: GMC family oxidoreductase [Longimicrobiales bacterium]|nr:GMC family oxidoreductase [Longimicrobiales bacterium]